jgi:hypothetical protein
MWWKASFMAALNHRSPPRKRFDVVVELKRVAAIPRFAYQIEKTSFMPALNAFVNLLRRIARQRVLPHNSGMTCTVRHLVTVPASAADFFSCVH